MTHLPGTTIPFNPNERTKEQDEEKIRLEQQERANCPACQAKRAHTDQELKERHPRSGTGWSRDH